MRPTFHLKTLSVAVAAFSIASVASAAGLDRSGQDITAFLQDGTYAEAVYTYLDADVTGTDISGNKVDDIAEDYDFFRYGVKADINDTFSIGVLYDEPFGAAALYEGDNNFVARGDRDATITAASGGQITNFAQAAGQFKALQEAAIGGATLTPEQQGQLGALGSALAIANAEAATKGEGTEVEVRTHSLTAIIGAKLGPNKAFQVYGGPVAQRVEADVKLRGISYGPATGYNASVSKDQDYGWLAGIAYSKPEIALKAALTYRSEIEHNTNVGEVYPLLAALGGNPTQSNTMEITTPKSVNFDFQTGINPTTLATAKVRWVPWSDFAIVPPLYNEVSKVNPDYQPDGLSLVSYDKDQWQVELGLAKRIAPAVAVSGTVGWDSGAGDPVTSLGPIKGYYSAGLGAKFDVTENWAISAGGKYLWFGDAKGQLPNKVAVANFEDNDGFALGVKLSYQAK